MSLLITVFTVVLVFTSVLLVLLVLMQRAKNDGGMGSAMGGSSMESTFGAETGNVLSGATIKAAIVFFVLSFGLYLANIYQSKHHEVIDTKLPTIVAPAPAPMSPVPITAGSAPATTGVSTVAPVTTPPPQPANPQPGETKKP
jgi:preprotein translocase subunit SecG